MKNSLFLLLLIAIAGCKPTKNPPVISTYEFSTIKELLIYDIIGDPEFKYTSRPDYNFTEIIRSDRGKFIKTNWREIKNTFIVNDSLQITNDLVIAFFSYSVKSDVIRGAEWIRKIDNKYFLSFIYLSTTVRLK